MDMENKRGQGLPTNTIILLVMGVAILVIMILGFSIGWSKILPFLSSDNVDSIVNGCQSACATQSVYGFCTQVRNLVDGDGNKIDKTCYDFSTNDSLKKYGISDCPGLNDECQKLASANPSQ